jgi:large subunit ribosomal protein L17
MRHLKRTAKLGRTGQHRNMMLSNLVCSLIKHKRIQTTMAKARAARSVAEKMVTLGKSGTLHDRRLASSRLLQDEAAVKILFDEIAPTQTERRGGYTRIIKLNRRQGDAADLAILEFVDVPVSEPAPATTEAPAAETKEGGEAAEAKPKKGGKKKKAAETKPA